MWHSHLILEKVEKLTNSLSSLQDCHNGTTEILESVKTECEILCTENRAMKNQVSDINHKLLKSNTTSDPTLILGDLLVKDIVPNKLINMEIQAEPEAKATDILPRLKESTNDTYCSIAVCAGTNDRNSKEFSAETISTVFRDIINAAKPKVTDVKSIKIASIPPRNDCKEVQQHIEALNAALIAITEDEGATSVNNDLSFKLADSSPNDGYLLTVGIHLTYNGTKRLAKNLKLPFDPMMGKTVGSNTPLEDAGHHKVKSYRKKDDAKPQTKTICQAPNQNYKGKECWFCGGKNHTSGNCRHGQKIVCHTCGVHGHKAKHCSQ